MMRMMNKACNGRGSWFGCTPMMAGMKNDNDNQPCNCCSMMGDMMNEEKGNPVDWWTMMEKMMKEEN